MKELRSYAVIVWLESDLKEVQLMPPPVYTGFYGSEMGNTIPRFVVTDPKSSTIWQKISYKKISGAAAKGTFRDVKRAVKAKLKIWEESAVGVEKNIPEGELRWTSSEGGRYYTGKFEKIEGDKVFLTGATRSMGVPLQNLSTVAQSYAKELGALQQSAREKKAIADKMPKLELEAWTSSDGNPLQATFTSLIDGKITIVNAAGKTYTFPMERLNEASQARAENLAEQIKKARQGL